jgi:rod shape-determining protein MreC
MARKLIRAPFPKRKKTGLASLSRPMLFTWFMLIGLILLFAPQNLTNDLQFAFARTFRWPLTIGKNISLYARTTQAPPEFRGKTQYENYIANLQEQLREKHEDVMELTGLRERLSALENAGLVVADVIRASINATKAELTINRGTDDGIAKGQFVLGDNSIIGTISGVSLRTRTARLKLFTDPASRVAVRIGQLNIDRLMLGSGNNLAKIRLLPTKHKVAVGDKVLAQKKPGFLDAAMIIGVVAQCKKDDRNPSLWDITVKPVCDTERLNTVTVIVMNPKE